MSVLVFVPLSEGKATKSGLEAASYANSISGGSATAVVSGIIEGDGGIGTVGIGKVLQYSKALMITPDLLSLLKQSLYLKEHQL